MPRVARFVIPDVPHHITQRGNFRQPIFFRDEDYQLYLNLLAQYATKYGLSILAYCLMPNHVHLIATPQYKHALPQTLQRLHSDYARYINLRMQRTGHLWQARYHSVALDEAHFWTAMVYVEQNPSRAGLVEHPLDWNWSSASLRLSEDKANPQQTLLNQEKWRSAHTHRSWKSCLDYGLDNGILYERIRESTLSGWPLGNERFHEIMEERLGFPTRKRKPGPQPHQLGSTTSTP